METASLTGPPSTRSRPQAWREPARLRPRHPAMSVLSARNLLAVQSAVGNAATATLVKRDLLPTVSRCGPDHPDCSCAHGAAAEPELAAVQRDPLFDLIRPQADVLNFTNRVFSKESREVVCPNCHRPAEPFPMPERFKDREATEPRLVAWAIESGKSLRSEGYITVLQLNPGTEGTLVDDFGVRLTKGITSSHEFDGSQAARGAGAETVRRRWTEIRPAVVEQMSSWYQNEFVAALGRSPRDAHMLTGPAEIHDLLTDPPEDRTYLGRLDAYASVGQQLGDIVVDGVSARGGSTIWFHLEDEPRWYYSLSGNAIVEADLFMADFARQVADKTKFAQYLMPGLLKVAAFGLGFSASISLVIAGIVLDELAEEMTRDIEGKPARSPTEILGSGGTSFLIDRILNKALGAGGQAPHPRAPVPRLEQIVDRAVPVVRKELAIAEKPLVQDALSEGAARTITDPALKAEGYLVEVPIMTAGARHLYRMRGDGTWCRFSAAVCGLDLGSDVAAATKSATSFTKGKLEDARQVLAQIEDELGFLATVYGRMKKAGKMDVTLLSAKDRAFLDDLAPSGNAADLTLVALRELPRKLGLKREFDRALEVEARLIEQLRRESRPLYETMRAVSPGHVARRQTLTLARGRDAATGMLPRSGILHVDHVVPVREIVDLPGFSGLRFRDQLAIVNDVTNLQAIDALANSSRSHRAWSEWPQGRIYYDDSALSKMRALESDLRAYLVGRIACGSHRHPGPA